jgi:glycosyltransferase involved in cell wall biosynthesis
MKLLYVTARWDPKDPDSGSGVNFQAYESLRTWVDEIKIAGPFKSKLTLFERSLQKAYNLLSKKRFIKFYPSYVKYSNEAVQKIMDEFKPDIIFSKASIPLVNVKLPVPYVYLSDSTIKWTKENWPQFSRLGMEIMERWEGKVIKKATHIITFCEANANILKAYYHKPDEQITVHPIPSALPQELSSFEDNPLSKSNPVKLLLVGKEYQRKGVDIAIKAAQILNDQGIPTQLRIVGQDGDESENVKFMGLYSKNVPAELQAYIDNYRWAHFMIFPTRFDAAAIVPSEAAAFGVPTITNRVGGLGTTVEDGVSGIVLKKHSPAGAYAETVKDYLENPDAYQALRTSTFQRYQEKLNWYAFGQQLRKIILDVLDQHKHG